MTVVGTTLNQSVGQRECYRDALEGTLAQLRRISDEFRPAVLACGFGPESMILIDLIATHAFAIEVVSVDTGRLPEETHALAQQVLERYGPLVQIVRPDPRSVREWTLANGENGFYENVGLRKECCALRKVQPLGRALAGKSAWLTGLRKEHSGHRARHTSRSWDAQFGLEKFNPLLDWTDEQVWSYIHEHDVPYNALLDNGYRSIGCAPCTRAVSPGEDGRAGRWWWERDSSKECGLHLDPETGQVQRARDLRTNEQAAQGEATRMSDVSEREALSVNRAGRLSSQVEPGGNSA